MGNNTNNNYKNHHDFSNVACGDMSGIHLCSIARNRQEQRSEIANYIASGLKNKKRCFYIATENSESEVCSWIRDQGINPQKQTQGGHLVFLDKSETYLQGGFFAPTRIFDWIENAHYEALKNGYHGLRMAGEASWALEDPPVLNKLLIDYESQINNIFARKKLSAMCLYNEDKFPEEILLNVLYTHPKVIIHGNFYNNPLYMSPERFKIRPYEPYLPGTYQSARDIVIKNGLA